MQDDAGSPGKANCKTPPMISHRTMGNHQVAVPAADIMPRQDPSHLDVFLTGHGDDFDDENFGSWNANDDEFLLGGMQISKSPKPSENLHAEQDQQREQQREQQRYRGQDRNREREQERERKQRQKLISPIHPKRSRRTPKQILKAPILNLETPMLLSDENKAQEAVNARRMLQQTRNDRAVRIIRNATRRRESLSGKATRSVEGIIGTNFSSSTAPSLTFSKLPQAQLKSSAKSPRIVDFSRLKPVDLTINVKAAGTLCNQPPDTLSGSKKIRKMHKGQLYMGRLVHPFTRWEKEAPPSSGTRKVTRDRDGRIRARDHLPRGFLSRKGRISVALAKK